MKITFERALEVLEAMGYELEQAEQEPVGEVVMESMGVGDAQIVRFRMNGRIPPVGTKLYAAPQPVKQEPVAEVVLRKQTIGFGRTEERKDVMFLVDVGVGSKLYAKPQHQAEQEPVAWMNTNGAVNKLREAGWAMNAAPVRTKDLTDDEIWEIADKLNRHLPAFHNEFARAVIAADREKNK